MKRLVDHIKGRITGYFSSESLRLLKEKQTVTIKMIFPRQSSRGQKPHIWNASYYLEPLGKYDITDSHSASETATQIVAAITAESPLLNKSFFVYGLFYSRHRWSTINV